jgi:hypothetical protein
VPSADLRNLVRVEALRPLVCQEPNMRALISLALVLALLAGCAGDTIESGDPPRSGPMQDLEPAGPADAVLENEVEE